jgi:acyl carrier protein
MFAEQIVTDVVAPLLDLDEDDLRMDQELSGLPGWDSVNALRVLVYLEREVGVSIDLERFNAAATLGDLAALVAELAPESQRGAR